MDRQLPNPGARLITRVSGGPDLEAFHRSGAASVTELRRTLAVVGRDLESFDAALDFGCGCGRMLIWLADVASSVELHGTDIDPEAIAWCRETLPYATFGVNGAEPPTAYADGQFDLVFNHSVFTHIDERLQDLWLTELQRITRPGALLVLSVHGETAVPEGAWEIRDRLAGEGIAYMDRTVPAQIGLPDWYQNTWHSAWYLFSHWQRWFRIRALITGGSLGLQDHVLLERLDGTPPRSLAPAGRARHSTEAGERVTAALASLRRYGTALDAPETSADRQVRMAARRMLLRLMRPYTLHQQKFNEAVALSIVELAHDQFDHDRVLQDQLANRPGENRQTAPEP